MGSSGLAYPNGRSPVRVLVGGRWRECSPGLRRQPRFRSVVFKGRFRISGVTRNSTGATLGNCTVLLFKNSAFREFVAETISDGSGNFAFDIGQNAGFFFIVAYLDGAPDLAGTTINEVIATEA